MWKLSKARYIDAVLSRSREKSISVATRCQPAGMGGVVKIGDETFPRVAHRQACIWCCPDHLRPYWPGRFFRSAGSCCRYRSPAHYKHRPIGTPIRDITSGMSLATRNHDQHGVEVVGSMKRVAFGVCGEWFWRTCADERALK